MVQLHALLQVDRQMTSTVHFAFALTFALQFGQ